MDVNQIIAAAVILLFASMLQSAVGFGFALLSTPLMLFFGVPLPITIMVICFAQMLQSSLGLRQYWAQVKWRPVFIHSIARAVTIPLGVFLLGYLVTFGQVRIQQMVGLLLLVVLVTQWAVRFKPRREVHVAWNWIAGGVSGLLTGLIGINGPPTVLWLAAHRWTSKQTRVFLWAVAVVGFPLIVIPLWIRFGHSVLVWGMAVSLGSLPMVWLGVRAGLWLGKHLPRPRLRVAVLVILLIIALSSLLRPLLPQGPQPGAKPPAQAVGMP